MGLHRRVKLIPFPTRNRYFERTSADGYAFLGLARHRMGLPIDKCLDEVISRAPRLNKAWHRKDGIELPEDTVYTYTIWPCYELYKKVGMDNNADALTKIFMNQIGFYHSGMARYCDYEIDLEVPNVSAIAALFLARSQRLTKSDALVKLLRNRQLQTGNWAYTRPVTGVAVNDGEDSAHLSIL